MHASGVSYTCLLGWGESPAGVLSEKCVYKVARPCRESNHERLGIFVALVQIVEHCFFQQANGGMAASTHTALGHLCEESFYQVEPTAAGRREVHVIARGRANQLRTFPTLCVPKLSITKCTSNPAGRLSSISFEKAQKKPDAGAADNNC